MKKIIFSIAVLGLISLQLAAQENIRLQFNKEGKFKIAQFTDLHWVHGEPTCARTTATIKAVLEAEKPDLAILTGDIAFHVPDREPWTDIPKIFEDAKVPYAVVMGNHDGEEATKISREEIFDILSRSPYFVGEKGPREIAGVGNYVLPVWGANQKPAALLYCFDSNNINIEKVLWYREQSEKYTQANRNHPVPALAFFHIPLSEYRYIFGKENTIGSMGEKVSAPAYSIGLLGSFVEKRDVFGVFVGHDHENDYIGTDYSDIVLAYGRVSGWEAYGKLERGARIINLREDQLIIDTWIRTAKGTELPFINPLILAPATPKTKPAKHGVSYTCYENNSQPFQSLDQVTSARKVKQGVMPQISIEDAPAKDYFAYEFHTWLQITQRDVYNFYMSSDDASRLYINGQEMLYSPIGDVQKKIALEPGFYELRALYYENDGSQSFNLDFSSRNIPRQSLPADQLFLPE